VHTRTRQFALGVQPVHNSNTTKTQKHETCSTTPNRPSTRVSVLKIRKLETFFHPAVAQPLSCHFSASAGTCLTAPLSLTSAPLASFARWLESMLIHSSGSCIVWVSSRNPHFPAFRSVSIQSCTQWMRAALSRPFYVTCEDGKRGPAAASTIPAQSEKIIASPSKVGLQHKMFPAKKHAAEHKHQT